jgi:hypothetical protein
MEVPMMDEGEYAIAFSLYGKGMNNVKEGKSDLESAFDELLDYYNGLSGFGETIPNAIMHHCLLNFGPDCPNCKKPLRTKKARYCAACGFGKEDLINQDTLPLIERRKELFNEL